MKNKIKMKLQLFAETKTSDMVNPEVMADMISAELPNKLKFAKFAEIDKTLEGQPGDTITIPSFEYIGDAEEMVEGVPLDTTQLKTSTKKATIKQSGKAVEILDKAVLCGKGDPIGESNKQLLTSIASKIDNDCVDALNEATLEHDNSSAKISYNSIVDSVDKFGEEDDEVKVMFIHSNQKATLRKDPEFIKNVPNAYMKGVVGEIGGCQIVTSNRVKKTETHYINPIIKSGALAIYLKRKAEVESDRDILKKSTVISADEYYVAALRDHSKVVKSLNKI